VKHTKAFAIASLLFLSIQPAYAGTYQVPESQHAQRNPFYHLLKTPEDALKAGEGWSAMAMAATNPKKKDDYWFKARSAFELAGWLSGDNTDLRFTAVLKLAESWLESAPGKETVPLLWHEMAANGKRAEDATWPFLWLRTAENTEHALLKALARATTPKEIDMARYSYAWGAASAYRSLLAAPGLDRINEAEQMRAFALYRRAVCECDGFPAGVRMLRHLNKPGPSGSGNDRCIANAEEALENPRIPNLAKAELWATLAREFTVYQELDGNLVRRPASLSKPHSNLYPRGVTDDSIQRFADSAERALNDKSADDAWKLPWKSYLPAEAMPSKAKVREILDTVKRFK
jgi:hypothetical protein